MGGINLLNEHKNIMKVWVSHKKLKSGNWRIRFIKKGKETGLTLPGRLKESTIKSKCAWYQEEIIRGNFDPFEAPSNLTVKKAVDAYLQGKKKDWNEKTYDSNEWRLNKMMQFIPEDEIIEDDTVWTWFEELDESPYSKKAYFITTRAFLNWCKKQGLIKNFTIELSATIKRNLKKKTIKYLTWEQLKHIEETYLALRSKTAKFNRNGTEAERHTRLWWVMFWQCLRKEEVPPIRQDWIQGEMMQVLGKGGKIKMIPIVDTAKPHIEWFQKHAVDDSLFGFKSMRNQEEELRRAITNAYPKRSKKGFHQLRHGGIVHYLTSGIPLIYVSKLARHENMEITSTTYADIISGMEGSAFSGIKDEGITGT